MFGAGQCSLAKKFLWQFEMNFPVHRQLHSTLVPASSFHTVHFNLTLLHNSPSCCPYGRWMRHRLRPPPPPPRKLTAALACSHRHMITKCFFNVVPSSFHSPGINWHCRSLILQQYLLVLQRFKWFIMFAKKKVPQKPTIVVNVIMNI